MKARNSKKICFVDYTKDFDCIDHNKLWKILKKSTRPPYPSPEKPVLGGKKQQLGPDMVRTRTVRTRQLTSSKLEKEYDKAVYCHPDYLISMLSTSCKMPGWMNHKLESSLPGEISGTSDIQVILL